MNVKKLLLTVVISATAWGGLAMSAAAETPVDGLLPGGTAPALPPLPILMEPEPAAETAPAGVSPEQCIDDGGNVERPQDGGPGFYCNGGAHDGMTIVHAQPQSAEARG